MRRTPLALAVLLAGCAVEPTSEAGQLRQALPFPLTFPSHVGRAADARLGTSLAACRAPAFVAGAPGDNSTFLFTDAGTWLTVTVAPGAWNAEAVGVAVACDGPAPDLKILTGGDQGTWMFSGAGQGQLDATPVEALERGPLASSPLLLGMPSVGKVGVQVPIPSGYQALSSLVGSPRFGHALAWDRLGTFFVVGDPETDSVKFFGWSGTSAQAGASLSGPAGSGFGSALAIGDVHPNPGAELIVGAPGTAEVFIYGDVGGQPARLMVLHQANAPAGSFGISLAIEPTPVAGGTLRALWVGDPLGDQVHRFVGDAGVALQSNSPASYFGFSLAVVEQKLLVGAPFYSDAANRQGAVYGLQLNTQVTNSVPMQCENNLLCITSTCQTGRCVGGVMCELAGNPLCGAAQCVNGTCTFPDAGATRPDAGTGFDAGSRDAGGEDKDAGTDDAGTDDAGTDDAGIDDAGVDDAGIEDAGADDAGSQPGKDAGTGKSDAGVTTADGGLEVQQFGTCGCSGAGAVPLLLLLLAWSRREQHQ